MDINLAYVFREFLKYSFYYLLNIRVANVAVLYIYLYIYIMNVTFFTITAAGFAYYRSTIDNEYLFYNLTLTIYLRKASMT